MAPEGSWSIRTFRQILIEAVRDLAERGYSSREQVESWLSLLRSAAERDLGSEYQIDADTRTILEGIYRRVTEGPRLEKYVPGVARYTLANVRPELRAELDRRILAAANLIKIHRREAIEKTLQRFEGWSTAIPKGGEGAIDKREVRAHIAKSVAQEKYERRRVNIDQGHKLISNVSEIVAVGSGAIGGIWHDRGEHDKNYDARKAHMARSGKVFLLKDSWAREQGLVRSEGRPYIEDIERPSQLPFCSCFYQWITSLRRVPDEFLTRKGQEFIRAQQPERKAA